MPALAPPLFCEHISGKIMIEKHALVKTETIRGEALTGVVEPHSSPKCEPMVKRFRNYHNIAPTPLSVMWQAFDQGEGADV